MVCLQLFDRRKKVASQSSSKKIKKFWEGITPDMMTEEESEEEKGFVRHRQSWRSDVFNRFMDKLDSSRNQKTLAKPRELGEQVERMPPICVKKWMTEGRMENSIEYNEFSDTTDDSQ